MKKFHVLIQFIALCLCLNQAEAQVAVVGELSHDTMVRQGESYDGVISLRNDSKEAQEAKVYQTDYLFHSTGESNYAQPGSTDRSNATWVTFSPSHVLVPAMGTAEIHYTVKVPADSQASLIGSYWSMIMVESIPKSSPESSLGDGEEVRMGIRQTIRYGIQIATHLLGSGKKSIEFVDAKLLREEDGGHLLQVDILNNGDLGMRPEVRVELFDTNGGPKGTFEGTRYRIYPGTSVRQRIPFQNVSDGTYTALIVIDDGDDDVFGAQYTLEF